MGVLVIVSAGNGGAPGAAAPVDAPANCSLLVPGVMGVVGLRNVGTKVGYSSFGSGASIAAPAGNRCNFGRLPALDRYHDERRDHGSGREQLHERAE